MSDIAIKPDGRNLTFAGMLFHTRVAFISVGSNKEQGSPGCEKEADRMRAAEHGMAKASKTRLCVGDRLALRTGGTSRGGGGVRVRVGDGEGGKEIKHLGTT